MQGVSNLDDDYAIPSKKERFTALLYRADDVTRQYYHGLREKFYQLKDLPNPALRAFYHYGQLLASLTYEALHTL